MALQTPVISLNKDTLVLSGTGGGVNQSGAAYGYGYEISQRNNDRTAWILVTRVVTDSTEFTCNLTGLVTVGCQVGVVQYRLTKSNSTYEYSTPYSNIETIPYPLKPPSNVTFDAITNTFSWSDASGDIASFKVYVSNGSAWSLLATVTTTETSGSLLLDGLVTESAELMVRTVEVDGGVSNDSPWYSLVVESSTTQAAYDLANVATVNFSVFGNINSLGRRLVG